MTKPTKKPKAAPTYEELEAEMDRILKGLFDLACDLDHLRNDLDERERTRWKASD